MAKGIYIFLTRKPVIMYGFTSVIKLNRRSENRPAPYSAHRDRCQYQCQNFSVSQSHNFKTKLAATLNASSPVSPVFDGPGSGDDNQPANDAESAKGLPVEACPVRQKYTSCSIMQQYYLLQTLSEYVAVNLK